MDFLTSLPCRIIIASASIYLFFRYFVPTTIIPTLELMYPTVVFKKDPAKNRNKISLTIDDSPSENTEKILDILKENNCKASFFVIGNYIDEYDNKGKILKRIIEEGHEICNHTMENNITLLRIQTLETNIKKWEDKLDSLNIKYKKFFRPGSGAFNQNMIDILNNHNYTLTLGNIYPYDPHIRFSCHHIDFILEKLDSGSIIILHDLKYNTDTLKILLPMIKEEGYDIVKLSDLN